MHVVPGDVLVHGQQSHPRRLRLRERPVRAAYDDAIATVTLTNPAKRNAQSPALWRALAQAGR
ncbi:hypothetical protein AB0D27_41160, partial [Streptomyces sp. NPDC048415]